MATSSRLLVNNGLYPQEYQLLPCARFCPVSGSICSQYYHPQGSLPSVCTTMSVRLPSYLFCLVCQVTCHNPVHTIIHSCIHTIIHSYVNTFTHSYTHAYTTYTRHHSHMIALVTKILFRSCLFSSVFTYHCVKPQVSTHEHLTFTFSSLKCHPQCVWSRDVTH